MRTEYAFRWDWIATVNGEAAPPHMPKLDPELVMLMAVDGVQEVLVERMLFFVARAENSFF